MAKPTTREVTLYGILGSLTFAAKFLMASLPNIEPVSLMVMLFGVTFRHRAIYPVFVYILLEFLFYGFGLWNIMYLYLWPLLAFLACTHRDMDSRLGWAMLSGGFGLLFGALCAPVDAAIGGAAYALSKWISGIPFDLAHCAGNFFLAFFLFCPLRRLLKRCHPSKEI